MRLGLIVRACNRGLGIQTWEMYRHMHPDKTLVIDLGDRSPYSQSVLKRYPDGRVVPLPDDSYLTDPIIREFLDGLDVIWTAEVPYNFRVYEIAREMGVRTVCHFNREFWNTGQIQPDVLWAPTSWRMHEVPGAVLMPFPVDRKRCRFHARQQATRFLHVAGVSPMGDRNGTSLVMEALRHLRIDIDLRVFSQGCMSSHPFDSKVGIITQDIPNYWDLYADCDVLLAPRRYGGQSLPMNEAMSCGLAVIATDCEPQSQWLPHEARLPVRSVSKLKAGTIIADVHNVDPMRIAQKIEDLVADPAIVQRLSKDSDERAEYLSWDKWEPLYRQAFEAVL